MAVVCDADQVIYAKMDKEDGNRVTYHSGSLESPRTSKHVTDVLEGTLKAFGVREAKYDVGYEKTIYGEDTYLFKTTEYRIRTSVESVDVGDFFRKRHDPDQARDFPTREERFSFFIWTHFRREGVLPQDIASDVGASKKRDRWSVSRQTINSFRAGQHVIPKKFQYICDQLHINKAERSIAKILYTEAYLGEFLLGDDPAVFKKLNFENYPRTAALLTYSTENDGILA